MSSLKETVWRIAWPWRAKRDATLLPGTLFPDFELSSTEGVLHRLSGGAQARTVLWFTNLCDGCQERAPLLNALLERHGTLVRVLAVNILEETDTARRVAPSLHFPLLLDPEDVVQKQLGIAHPPGSCPMHNLYVIGAGRIVLFRHHLSAMKPADIARLAEL